MDSIKNLLLSKNLDQPSEMKSIHDFISKNLGHKFEVRDYPKHTTICVGSGKIAYVVRTKLPDLIAYAAPTKDIRVRIDSNLQV